MTDAGRKEKYPTLWVIMFKGYAGWRHSFDTGNPFKYKRSAQKALARQGKEKASLYTIVKYLPAERPSR